MNQTNPSSLRRLATTTANPIRPPVKTPRAGPVPGSSKPKTIPTVTTRLTFDQRRRMSQLARQREADLPFVEIDEVFFTIFSTEEIKAIAVTMVDNTEQKGPGSINDPQMGPTDHNTLCATCSQDITGCPGHPGYIQLPEPILHPLLMREVISVLNIVCNDCGCMLLRRDEITDRGILHSTGASRLTALEKASVGLACRRCPQEGERPCLQNPTYKAKKTRDNNQITYEYIVDGNKKDNIREPREILDIFSNITQEDAELMGYTNGAHPRRMIMEVLMVIPPVVRPSNIENGMYMADPLTTMYIDIIRHVKYLRDALGGTEDIEASRRRGERKKKKEQTIQDHRKNLFERLKHFINNTDRWYTGGGQPFTSLVEIFQGKTGLIRQNMMSKRVDFSSRTVLSPDPSIEFGQISVPIWMAPILTPRVMVNRYNRNEMQNLLVAGHITYITFKERPDDPMAPEAQLAGTRNQVTEKYRGNYQLQDGDTVERWMQDGDIVIFNRAPTLHKYSFMSYRAVLRDQKTFGLHLSYTTPLNADFDGDEGNVHILQVLDSRAEAEELMSVQNCLINSQSNKPTMGIVFNGPVASMLLTRPETTIRPADYHDSITYLKEMVQIPTLEGRMAKYNTPMTQAVDVGRRYFLQDGDARIDLDRDGGAFQYIDSAGVKISVPADQALEETIYENHYTGRALFSALLPEDLFYEGPKGVIIQEGVLTHGVITKSHIGPERNSIIHVMAMTYSASRVSNFLTDATYVLNRFLSTVGFSMGISSCLVQDPGFADQVRDEIERARLMVTATGDRPDDPVEADRWDEQILAYIGGPADKIGRYLQTNLPKDNSLSVASESGAKGNASNLIQIAAFLGQQHLEGKRPTKSMTYETRCLPWFTPEDDSLEAHGFCPSGFLKGVSPREMYFHSMASREGLMETAVSTWETGFMHRKAVKTLQDCKTAYDGSVRNVDKTMFQYVYGDDGFSPTRLQTVTTSQGEFLSFIDAKNVAAQINARYGF